MVLGAVVAAIGSATSQSSPPPPQYAAPGPGQPQAQTYSPCEYACGQISRCYLAQYPSCVAQCRQNGTEQQPGGPEQLTVISQSTCEQLQASMQQVPGAQQPVSSATTSAGIDVDFDVPPGYTSAQQGSMIVLTPQGLDDATPCVYGLSPARRSTGSYDQDASAALLEPVPGWQRKDQTINYAMRGTSATGWPYYWVRADAMRPGQSYEYMTVMAMAFPASNGQVSILWGIGSPAKCLADDATFARLFHSLRPRGWQSDGGKTLAQNLIGLWRNSQSIGMGQYSFKAGGRYEFAINTTTDIGYLERTSTSLHEGNYALANGVLTLSPDRTSRGSERLRIRIYDEYSLGRWTRSLATLDETAQQSREVQYYWIDRK